MGQAGEYQYNIAQRDLDFARRPTLVAVANSVIRAASDDADRNGFGISDLAVHNWTWVLARLAIDFRRYPTQNDTLHIKTWISEVNRLMTTRNFIISDGAGGVIGEAVSNWAMLDIASRRAVDLSAYTSYSQAIVDIPPPTGLPLRLGAVDGELCATHTVVYSDLDFNGHTTSMRYLQMMLDSLSLEIIAGSVKRMDINFLHESRWGDILSLAKQPQASLFEVRNQDGMALCRSRTEWQPA